MHKVRQVLLEGLFEICKKTYPYEFIGLLGVTKDPNVIDELVVADAVFGDKFSTLRMDKVPADKTIVGSIHSHPSRAAYPSQADLSTFKKLGKTHLIIGYPYDFYSVKMYNAQGQLQRLEVVQ